jgi:hypothetical protein
VVGRTFESRDCSGTPRSIQSSSIQATVDLWITVHASMEADDKVRSLLVELSVGKPSSVEDDASLVFDNVLVR